MFGRTSAIFLALTIMLILIFSTDAQIVEEGLVSYWPLDEAYMDGNEIKDFEGTNDGRTSGTPEAVEGVVGEALAVNGKDSCVVVDDSASLDVTEAITVEVWIKPAALTVQYPGIVCKWDWGSGNRSYGLYLNEFTKPWFMISDTGAYIGGNYDCISATVLTVDKWYHLVGVYDGAKLMLYIDGTRACEKDLATTIFSGSAKLSIGSSTSGGAIAADEVFNGIIDEIRIYNKPLNETEIQQNYESREQASVTPARKISLTWGWMKTLGTF